MTGDAPALVARDEFTVTRKRDRLDGDAGFLRDLAHDRLMQGFARFHDAARQRVEAGARALGAPRDQNMAVADDGGAHREIRPLGIHAGVGHRIGLILRSGA